MYYHMYLYHGSKYNYYCVITQTLQNGQTLGQFFELLYIDQRSLQDGKCSCTDLPMCQITIDFQVVVRFYYYFSLAWMSSIIDWTLVRVRLTQLQHYTIGAQFGISDSWSLASSGSGWLHSDDFAYTTYVDYLDRYIEHWHVHMFNVTYQA